MMTRFKPRYVALLAVALASPAGLLACVRGHWGIEHLHWLRDVICGENKSTIRTGNAAPGDVRPHPPRHHPVPATRSNQNQSRDTPQRPEPRQPLQLLALRPG